MNPYKPSTILDVVLERILFGFIREVTARSIEEYHLVVLQGGGLEIVDVGREFEIKISGPF